MGTQTAAMTMQTRQNRSRRHAERSAIPNRPCEHTFSELVTFAARRSANRHDERVHSTFWPQLRLRGQPYFNKVGPRTTTRPQDVCYLLTAFSTPTENAAINSDHRHPPLRPIHKHNEQSSISRISNCRNANTPEQFGKPFGTLDNCQATIGPAGRSS